MQKRTLYIIIGGIVGFVILACLGCLAVSLIESSSPTFKATATAKAIARATEAAKPTSLPASSKISQPTNTQPTNTSAPTQPTKRSALIPTLAIPTPRPTLTYRPTITPRSTVTPKPTVTPGPTKPPAPTPTTEPKKVGLLIGLQPADVKVNLENRQFECSSAEMSAVKTYYVWTCQRDSSAYQMMVFFYGQTLLTVDYINCVVLQFGQADDGIALPFLGFMATMPYDGAEPQRARTWVEQTLPTIKQSGDVREATFGGVKHRLFGIPTARNLQIGDLR